MLTVLRQCSICLPFPLSLLPCFFTPHFISLLPSNFVLSPGSPPFHPFLSVSSCRVLIFPFPSIASLPHSSFSSFTFSQLVFFSLSPGISHTSFLMPTFLSSLTSLFSFTPSLLSPLLHPLLTHTPLYPPSQHHVFSFKDLRKLFQLYEAQTTAIYCSPTRDIPDYLIFLASSTPILPAAPKS